MKNCHYGCPCSDGAWECPKEDVLDANVLVLQHDGNNGKFQPFIIDFNGNINDNVQINFGDETDLSGSCAAILKGQWFVFGGDTQKRQVLIF